MTKYKYTKKNCYAVAKSIIDYMNYNKKRGFDSSRCNIYLYEHNEKLRGYIHIRGMGFCKFINKEKDIEITDWFRDRPPYTKKELANMIYTFYEVVQ